jgi:hypothetical protein
MDLFKRKKFEVWKYNDEKLACWVLDRRMALKINRLLNKPYSEISEDSEPVFFFHESLIQQVEKILNIKNNMLSNKWKRIKSRTFFKAQKRALKSNTIEMRQE